MGWIQVPGQGTQIAVAANDIPYVIDTDGYAEYLAPRKTVCNAVMCATTERQWVMVDGKKVTQIAADPYGYLWEVTRTGGRVRIETFSKTAFDTTTREVGDLGGLGCISSLAPGRFKPPIEWNYPFGVAAKNTVIPHDNAIWAPFTPMYSTSCNSPSLQVAQVEFFQDITHFWTTWNPWNQLDTGELQVTQFTIDGSADRVPWIRAPRWDNKVTAWAVYNSNYNATPVPVSRGAERSITYLTDHYAVADNMVWGWNGDAYGNRGNPVWVKLANSQWPTGIAQIAYAMPLPGTAIGTIGPSNLYMVDANHNIYQYGDVTDSGTTPK